MAWARANAAAFGGDADRVMIHGCSAGGVSIANHLSSPLSWPHFHAAVMESGNHLTFTDAVAMDDAQRGFDALRRDALLRSGFYGKSYHASPVMDG
eukprot:gene35695-28878_t